MNEIRLEERLTAFLDGLLGRVWCVGIILDTTFTIIVVWVLGFGIV